MGFKKLLTIMVFCIAGNYIYDKYIRIGFNSVYINPNNICSISDSVTYLFVFRKRRVTVKDPYNKIITLILNKSALISKLKIECDQNKKKFVLNTTAGLKTQSDSLGIGTTIDKLHGYMGIWEKHNCYHVDQNGTFISCDKL